MKFKTLASLTVATSLPGIAALAGFCAAPVLESVPAASHKAVRAIPAEVQFLAVAHTLSPLDDSALLEYGQVVCTTIDAGARPESIAYFAGTQRTPDGTDWYALTYAAIDRLC